MTRCTLCNGTRNVIQGDGPLKCSCGDESREWLGQDASAKRESGVVSATE